ncbi:MAG: hypothetical protein U1C19_03125 [Methanobacteriaceae archaeon]|nr:hypothetical protein [Methanobacteriaceae archaeon]
MMALKAVEKLRNSSKQLKKLNHNSLQVMVVKVKAPTWKPNPNIGEGVPTEEELKYRQSLINEFKTVTIKAKKIINSDKLPEEKLEEIDHIIRDLETKLKQIITRTVRTRFQAGFDEVQNRLTEARYSKLKDKDSRKRLSTVLQLQLDNLEDICFQLKNKWRSLILKQSLKTGTIVQKDDKKKKKKDTVDYEDECDDEESEEDTEFCGLLPHTQDRLDKTGFAGWIETYKEGLIGAVLLAAPMVDRLRVYWDSVGDESVCITCQEYEENSPYTIIEVPETPHFGCRCNLRVEIE